MAAPRALAAALLAACVGPHSAQEQTVKRVAVGWTQEMEAPALQQKLKAEPERLILAEFYAPWCGHCKEFKPSWEQVAGRLLGDDEGDMDAVQVDATKDQDLAQEFFGVQQYPTILLLKGEMMLKYPIEIPDDLTEDALYKWVTEAVEIEKRPLPTVLELESRAELTKFLGRAPVVTLLCFFPDADNWPKENLTSVAEVFPDWTVAALMGEPAVAEEYGVEGAGAVLLRNHAYDTMQVAYTTELEGEGEDEEALGKLDWTVKAVGEFLDSAGPSVIRSYSRKTGRSINRMVSYSGLALMMFVDPATEQHCEEVATPIARKHYTPDHEGEVTFVIFRPDDHKENVGVYGFFGFTDESQLPLLLLADTKNPDDSDGTHANMKIYPVESVRGNPCDPVAIEATIDGYFSDPESLTQTFDHVVTPTGVRQVTADTYEEVVRATPLVFLELYAPWCGHCKKLEPEFEATNKSMVEAGFFDLELVALDGTSPGADAVMQQ